MKALQIWITYHDDSQIEDFGLAEDAVFRLFKGTIYDVQERERKSLNQY